MRNMLFSQEKWQCRVRSFSDKTDLLVDFTPISQWKTCFFIQQLEVQGSRSLRV
jgi:hypothetical protein